MGTDDIYFPLPIVGMVSYPFSWMALLITLGGVALLILIIVGFARKRITAGQMLLGFVPLLGSLVLSYLVPNYTWVALKSTAFYVEQSSVFPATGYLWIAAAAFFWCCRCLFLISSGL